MSVFRPSVCLTAPDGRDWELYAYRIRLRERGPAFDPGLAGDAAVGTTSATAPYAEYEAAGDALDGLLWLLGLVPRLLARLLWDAPRAGVRALASDVWTIEAITWEPRRTSYAWTTTGEFRHNVLARVQGQLSRGETPRPRHATYLGARG